MAREFSSTVRQLLRTQVLRSDYLIVAEQPSIATRLPYEQKLERVHDLCIRNRYRTAPECESIRNELYRSQDITDRPAALLLTESYLPDCVIKAGQQNELQLLRLMRNLERQARQLSGNTRHFQSSTLKWNESSYLMCLPLDIHYLLIENDGALLAA